MIRALLLAFSLLMSAQAGAVQFIKCGSVPDRLRDLQRSTDAPRSHYLLQDEGCFANSRRDEPVRREVQLSRGIRRRRCDTDGVIRFASVFAQRFDRIRGLLDDDGYERQGDSKDSDDVLGTVTDLRREFYIPARVRLCKSSKGRGRSCWEVSSAPIFGANVIVPGSI
jgi:hypothetical protein